MSGSTVLPSTGSGRELVERSSPPRGSLPKGSLKSANSAVKNADQPAFSTDSKPHTNNCKFKHKLGRSKTRSPKNAAHIDLLLSDEESIKPEARLGTAIEAPKTNTIQLEDSLKNQVENLEKQVEEIRQITGDASLQQALKSQTAQDVQQAVAEQSRPINNTLSELTQQVAAIREYASGQQDRVKKLQEGYDLNIIKNFCLRVIRCIDNLESCIGRQSEQSSETMHLKEARDELLFALESSGVEQFEPEINSDYRGQERHAEAIKEKECSDDPNLAGKIAKVIKPGYQYFIDEENVKVVRPAMVKLFG
ncbi:MAG: nucleotide exchange factor GrpE [Phycisphaerae bacterium]